MAHRKAGLAGLQTQRKQAQSFKAVGADISANQVEAMQTQMASFQKNLEEFAEKYRKTINKNPEFRKHFQDMCMNIGVDPLASNKGFWAELLGVGDFYYELGVQIIEAGLRTRNSNGGLMELPDLVAYLEKMRGRNRRKAAQPISSDDVERAIDKLAILGSGLRVLQSGKRKLVQMVPCELDNDHAAVLTAAQEHGWVTRSMLRKNLGWPEVRIDKVLQPFIREGMIWIDQQEAERQYWFPSLLHIF